MTTVERRALVQFLLDRVREDNEAAQRASQGHWKVWGMSVLADQDGTNRYETAERVADTAGPGGELRTWNAAHIARWEPRRVLAECEAKSRLLDLNRYCGSGTGLCDDGGHADETGCGTLALLALSYAGHPDYRREWSY